MARVRRTPTPVPVEVLERVEASVKEERLRLEQLSFVELQRLYREADHLETATAREMLEQLVVDVRAELLDAAVTRRIPVSEGLRPAVPEWTPFH